MADQARPQLTITGLDLSSAVIVMCAMVRLLMCQHSRASKNILWRFPFAFESASALEVLHVLHGSTSTTKKKFILITRWLPNAGKIIHIFLQYLFTSTVAFPKFNLLEPSRKLPLRF